MRKTLGRIIAASLASLMVVTAGTNTVLAIDEEFYSGNDVFFYDPNACATPDTGGTGVPDVQTTESMDKNAEIIFKFLISTTFSGLGNKPFNAVQAAGALGNFYRESKFDPGAIESNGEGHGLAQWSFGRKTQLFNLAEKEGKPWNDMGLQLKMIEIEINKTYGKRLLDQGFGSVTDPGKAAETFEAIYEVAGVVANEERTAAAKKYYEKFKDMAPGGVSLDGSSSCATGTETDFADDGFVVYNQCDSRWGNKRYIGGGGSNSICAAGCGPSAMAMIITALTDQHVTPEDTVAYANTKNLYIPGNGSSWDVAPVLAEHWGLKARNIDNTVAAVNQVLESGGLVVTSGQGPAPFTSGGHYIVIRGVSEDGKWKVGDSNGQKGQNNSTKLWDPRAILTSANAGNVVAITK